MTALKQQHTRGLWMASPAPNRNDGYAIKVGDDTLARVQRTRYHGDDGPMDAYDQANACLIASAPALLEACRRVLTHPLLMDQLPDDIAEQLRAAIARATDGLTPPPMIRGI